MRITSGRLKNRQLKCPKGNETRPTSERLREALCNICQNYLEGARFLDLFAGSGAMGFEALSRGASSCTLIDQSRESTRCIQENIVQLKLESQTKVICGNVFTWLKKLSQQEMVFDIIYADPPYDAQLKLPDGSQIFYSQELLHFCDTHPLLAPNGTLFIEDSTHFQPDLSQLQALEYISSRRLGRSTLHQFTIK
jgi:16S rRNA (guanine966-N2)-methyltransferase